MSLSPDHVTRAQAPWPSQPQHARPHICHVRIRCSTRPPCCNTPRRPAPHPHPPRSLTYIKTTTAGSGRSAHKTPTGPRAQSSTDRGERQERGRRARTPSKYSHSAEEASRQPRAGQQHEPPWEARLGPRQESKQARRQYYLFTRAGGPWRRRTRARRSYPSPIAPSTRPEPLPARVRSVYDPMQPTGSSAGGASSLHGAMRTVAKLSS